MNTVARELEAEPRPKNLFGLRTELRSVSAGRELALSAALALSIVPLLLSSAEAPLLGWRAVLGVLLLVSSLAALLPHALEASGALARGVVRSELLVVSAAIAGTVLSIVPLAAGAGELAFARWLFGAALLNALAPLVLHGLARVEAELAARVAADLARGSSNRAVRFAPAPAGAILELSAGMIVPNDGVLRSGTVLVSERWLTGLRRLRVQASGAELFAGSEIIRGTGEFEAALPAADSVGLTFFERLAAVLDPSGALSRAASLRSVIHTVLLFCAPAGALAVREFGASEAAMAGAALAVLGAAPLTLLVSAVLLRRALAGYALFERGALVSAASDLERIERARRLVVHLEEQGGPGSPLVRELTIIDARVDRGALLGAVLALCGSTGDPYLAALEAAALRDAPPEFPLFHAHEARRYRAGAVSGTVQDAEFSIGDEEFMLERGVRLDPSDLVQPGARERVLYVAVSDSVMASVRVAEPFAGDGRALVSALRARGVTVLAWGSAPSEKLDPLGKEAGLELAHIEGALEPAALAERLSGADDTLFLACEATAGGVIDRATLPIVPFDEVRWELEPRAVTFFASRLDLLAEALIAVRRLGTSSAWALAAGCVLGAVSLAGGVTGALPFWAVPAGALAAAGAACILPLRTLTAPRP